MVKFGIVTGGASGIGANIIEKLVDSGSSVIIADIDDDKGLHIEKKLANSTGKIKYIHCDVKNANECKSVIDISEKFLGRIDFIINAAGIVITKSTHKIIEDEWNEVIDTNLKGTFLMTKFAIPHLKKTSGSIINIASIAGLVGFLNISSYCASKGGVIAFTKSLAIELIQSGIRVNCVCPGSVNTPFMDDLISKSKNKEAAIAHATSKTPMKRMAEPSEISPIILFLLDEEKSSFMTGSIITIDGGYTAQ